MCREIVRGDVAVLNERGNVVQRHERNHMGGYERQYFRLTFTGKPLEIKHVHSTSDTIITDIVRYSYDNMERQLTISLDHNGTGETPLSSNAYGIFKLNDYERYFNNIKALSQ